MSVAVLDEPRLRPMQEADLDAVAAIEQSVCSHGWNRTIFQDCLRTRYSCWVLEQQGEVRGYGILSAAAGEAHILNLAVDPMLQGRGLGRMMMDFLLGLARERHADIVFLEVRPSNRVALHLYESMGFNRIGIRRDYYPAVRGREDALIMACSL